MSTGAVGHDTHCSCVALGNNALLITGASGSGKSTLAVEMIALGCRLVADDYVELVRCEDTLIAAAPQKTAGLIEAHGIGILKADHQSNAVVRYIVDLDEPPKARLPASATRNMLGLDLELIAGHGIHALASKLVILLKGARLPVAPA